MRREELARYAAPAAFLLAATIAILLIRAGLNSDNQPASAQPTVTVPTTLTNDDVPTQTAVVTDIATTTTDTAEAEFYEIRSGDTLGVVAEDHDTTVDRLLELNPGIDPAALTPGQRIRVR